MRKAFTSTLEILASLIPLSLYPRLLPRDVIDVFYHAVSDAPMPHVRNLYPVVPVADFEAALLYLKVNFTFVNYAQIHAHIFAGEPLPANAVHLSFDDGYAECFSVVRPLLLEYGIPCTFFLTTGLIDHQILFYRNKQSLCIERLKTQNFPFDELENLPGNPPRENKEAFISWLENLRLSDEAVIDEVCQALGVDWQRFLRENQPYLSCAQIQQMHAEGFTIGAHTVTHRKLMDLPAVEIEAEIVNSCQAVAAITGQKVVPFSFPHSAWGLDRQLLSEIRLRHLEIGLLFDTKGLRRDVNFIHNRVWAERPLTPQRRLHSLSEVLKKSYQEAWMDEVFAKGHKAKSRFS